MKPTLPAAIFLVVIGWVAVFCVSYMFVPACGGGYCWYSSGAAFAYSVLIFLFRRRGLRVAGIVLAAVSGVLLVSDTVTHLKWMERGPWIRARCLLTSLDLAARMYHDEYGEYPKGTMDEVIQALCGANPKKVVFVEFPVGRSAENDHAIDGWGTAVRLDLTNEGMRFISAGADRTFGTADDLSSERQK